MRDKKSSGKLIDFELTQHERRKAKELLDELNRIGPDGLEDWNIRAQTFLVFVAIRNPRAFFEDNP